MTVDADVVRSSGLFDEDYYAAANPDVVEAGVDPLTHFCATGWLELRRPRADFDVWWYWTTHLDPRSEDVNPFVHWITEGRAAGLAGLPATTEARPSNAPTSSPRRLCLFAAFDRDQRVDDHVVRYVAELARHCDVFALHDGYLPPAELAKLDGIARGVWAIRHGAYDFGSWSMLLRDLVGWDVVDTYDELLLVNDSCYLLRPLDDVFARMDATACDWWGLQATKGLAKTRDVPSNLFVDPVPVADLRDGPLDEFERDAIYDFHVGSYFVVYRRPVLDDARFRRILDSVGPQRGKLAVIQKYEIGLTHFLVGNGYGFATYVDALYPFHPLFSEWHFTLIEQGFPLLKKYFLYQNHYDVPGLAAWKERVTALVPHAPVDTLEADLLRTAPHDRLVRSMAIRRADDGSVVVPTVLTGRDFRRADGATKCQDHIWAFVVGAGLHTLPASSRAVLEQARLDPAVTPVVLTRSRAVDLPGDGVVTAPLASPEGQGFLMRAGHVIVDDLPRRSIGERLSDDHRVVLVRDGLALRVDRLGQTRPRSLDRMPVSPVHALLTASHLDQLVALALHHPVRYTDGWRTGIPAHDFLVNPVDELPVDLAEETTRLQDELAGRRLVLVAPAAPLAARTPYVVTSTELDRLVAWCEHTGSVVGVREDPRDLDAPWSQQLESLALDLSHHRYRSTQVVLRHADAVVTDYSGIALDAAVTGRTVVSLAPDLADAAPTLVLDLEQALPGPVCRTLAEVVDALERADAVTSDEAPLQAAHRLLLAPRPDGRAAARVVARLLRGTPVEAVG